MLLLFFQAEDGIRDELVTGVQTCALPISIVSSGFCEIVVVASSDCALVWLVVTVAMFCNVVPASISAWVTKCVALYTQVSPTSSVPTSVASPLAGVDGTVSPNPFSLSVIVTQIGRASCRERV